MCTCARATPISSPGEREYSREKIEIERGGRGFRREKEGEERGGRPGGGRRRLVDSRHVNRLSRLKFVDVVFLNLGVIKTEIVLQAVAFFN